jgi:S1-C subfamily serine protease
VVTVIHRLRGWKLLKRLAASPGHMISVDELPGASDVHTNIVAGFVSEDGRTVMARLPQAEAEVEAASVGAWPQSFLGQPLGYSSEASDLMLVRSDGARFKAKFVGLDASTGLSLLEASEPLLPPQPAPTTPAPFTPVVAVGQPLHIYGPMPVARAPRPGAVTQPGAPLGYTGTTDGFIYLNMGEMEGRLTQVQRAASGSPVQVTARTHNSSPAWTGAVVTNDAGLLVGIVAESSLTETRIVPAEVIRGAAERVRNRRASVPQPWLGARGAAVSATSLDWFLSKGWDRKNVAPLVNRGYGVLLTGVIPGTPAALGGLRSGDVIMSIGEKEVRGIEDFSQLLKEAGVGSLVNFKVLRRLENAPLEFSVRLSAKQNPVRATREAEVHAAEEVVSRERANIDASRRALIEARAQLSAASASARAERVKARRLRTNENPRDYVLRLAEIEKKLRETEAREMELKAGISEAEKRLLKAEARISVAETRLRLAEGAVSSTRVPATPAARSVRADRPLRIYGLETIGLTPRSAATLKAANGLLVVSVRAESPAAKCGLKPGDVIETIDGRRLAAPHWTASLPPAGSVNLTLGVVREGQRLTLTLSRK